MTDNIKHVILLLMENQSFDRLLGCFRQFYPDIEALNAAGAPAWTNRDDKGTVFAQQPTTTKQVTPDPRHEVRFVLEQIANNHSGFVLDFSRSYPTSTNDQRQEIMGYYPLDFFASAAHIRKTLHDLLPLVLFITGSDLAQPVFCVSGTCHGQALLPEGWDDPQLVRASYAVWTIIDIAEFTRI